MENIAMKPQKRISQRIAEFLFTLYLITLYIFVGKEETVIISKVVFVIFALFTIVAVLRRNSIQIGGNVMIVYISFTWMFATVFWAKNEHEAAIMMKTMWQLFIQFFLVYNLFAKEENAHEYLLKSLYIAGLVLIAYSFYIYGFNDVIEMMTLEENVRLGTEINQANTFGMMNATTVMVAFYYLLYKKRFKAIHVATIIVSFLYAMSSGSRKALLMVCLGVLMLLYKKYGIKRQVYKTIVLTAALVLLFSAVIKLPMFDTINQRVEQAIEVITGKGNGDASTRIRLNMITSGWSAFKDRIATGYGVNNYRFVSVYRSYSHNNFIETLVNTGLIGFFLYYLVYFRAFRNLWKEKTDAGKAVFAIFIVRIVLEYAMVTYYNKLHWVLMAFFLISTTEELPKKRKKKNSLFDNEMPQEKNSIYEGKNILNSSSGILKR